MKAPGARVVGLGQPMAGDDAVGLEVVARLRAEGVPPGVEVLEAADGAALLLLLETPRPVLVVDALVGDGAPGEIVELDERGVVTASGRLVSSHALDVGRAIALGRVLLGPRATPSVWFVGVAIAPPACGTVGLRPVTRAAVALAVRAVRARLGA